MIRLATRDDVREMVDLAEEVHAAAGLPAVFPFNREAVKFDTIEYMNSEKAGSFVAEHEGQIVGAACVVLRPEFFNHNYLVAQELWSWVRPENMDMVGFAMHRAIEEWAKSQGAVGLNWLTPQLGYQLAPELRTAHDFHGGFAGDLALTMQ